MKNFYGFRVAFALLLVISGATHLRCHAQEAPFSRGINLTGWFQVPSARQIQFTRYTRGDLADIQSLGFDVIRLPINLHYMTDGAPDYNLDTLFLEFLDQVVDWAEELGIHLILDNHTFDPSADTDPQIGTILTRVWEQMARHFVDRSDYLYYEILNEPHGISDALWNTIQQSVIEEIRLHDTVHYIVIGPAGWNSYNNLAAMPDYEDDKLIYTFHFYDPFLFTHQGATWVEPSMIDIVNVPFPHDAGTLPEMPPEVAGTWVGSLFNSYQNEGTVARVKELIDIAVQFRDQRGIPIFCGEFGVYQPNSEESYRTFWYQVVREYLEAHQIAWTMWDYHGGFGLFEEGGNGLFDHDLNIPLLEALGMTIPEQTNYELKPDSTGFILYDDYVGHSLFDRSYTDGSLDYYSTSRPNNGKYCIHWTGAGQYRAIVLDFRPDRDLTRLHAEDFALDLMIRGDDPITSIDLRFIDTGSQVPYDVPWRMGTTINGVVVDFDDQWHHLHIPLKNLVEKGGWDGEWHNPVGEFDWSAVDVFEIVPEVRALGSANLYFDNIHITNLDTAQVNVDTTSGPGTFVPGPGTSPFLIRSYPNPSHGFLTLDVPSGTPLQYSIWDLNGRMLLKAPLPARTQLDLTSLSDGLYILEVTDNATILERSKITLRKQ